MIMAELNCLFDLVFWDKGQLVGAQLDDIRQRTVASQEIYKILSQGFWRTDIVDAAFAWFGLSFDHSVSCFYKALLVCHFVSFSKWVIRKVSAATQPPWKWQEICDNARG